jgi:cell division protein FtsL
MALPVSLESVRYSSAVSLTLVKISKTEKALLTSVTVNALVKQMLTVLSAPAKHQNN